MPDFNGNNNKNNNQQPGGPQKKNVVTLVSMILWIVALTFVFYTFTQNQQKANAVELEYGVFRQMVADGKISRVVMSSDRYMVYPKVDIDGNAAAPGTGAEVELFDLQKELENAQATLEELRANRPPLDGDGSALDNHEREVAACEQLIRDIQDRKNRVTVYYCTPVTDAGLIPLMDEVGLEHYGVETQSRLLALLMAALPSILMVGLFYLIMRSMFSKMGGGIGGPGGVGKANAKVYVERTTGVTFRDVAGQDEAKESLQEIIDILHNPGKYTEIGAKLPKGALLVGPPGTGKTLLAKAIAGEANVPFFSISGSDFVEMYVGVGASRVRDLFKEAAKMAPCIIFIDEIDTIGKSRNDRFGGGNDEREQTLNQLLAELDGFDPTKGVIVLGATNRPEVLDQALLRPGRFDRRITIDRPNLAGRIATLQVHTRKIKLAEDVNLEKIALATAGCVGADLANMVNEAALRAVRKGRRLVTQEDLLSAFEFVIVGSEKKGSVLTEFEKKLVAYHEVGHAMVAYKQKNGKPVQKITIVPHTQGALGYTLHLPEEDKVLATKKELLAQITTSMGGRAAEQLVMNEETNGAAQDIQDATALARNMVALYGMSEKFGMMALASKRSQYLDGGYGIDCAQDTAADIDEAVRVIISNAYDEAVRILTENREDMDKVAEYLLAKETITGAEMVAILEGRDPEAVEESYGSTKGGDTGLRVSLDRSEGERKAPEGLADQPESEGRQTSDQTGVEPDNADSKARKPLYGDVEPPAKAVHMVSEPVAAPTLEEPTEEEPAPEPDKATPEETPAEPESEEKPF